jgi:RNA polymerase sigma-70 factor (ECF subfamily)
VEADADAELMLRVAAGEKEAFATLFDRYQASVARFAYRFVGNRALAEELAQEVFFRLYRSAKRYRPSAKFKTFLFRVATNCCLNEVRRWEYQVSRSVTESGEPSEIESLAADSARPDQALDGKELEAAVAAALREMSPRERAAFVMCRFEGMAYREIAVALSATEAAVKSLIHRATLAVARRIETLEMGAEPARSPA